MDKVRVETISDKTTTGCGEKLQSFLRGDNVSLIISITQSELYDESSDWYQITYTVVYR